MKKMTPVILFLVFWLFACNLGMLPEENSQPPTETVPVMAATATQPLGTIPLPSTTPTPTPLGQAETSSPGNTPIVIAVTLMPSETPFSTPEPGQPVALTGLHMVSAESGWGIDGNGHILRTRDGGLGWQDVTPSQGIYSDNGFFVLNANTAWATAACNENCLSDVQSVTVWHTTDGGVTWTNPSLCLKGHCGYVPDVIAGYYTPNSLRFLDAKTGWLLASVNQLMFQDRYRLYKTVDGGATWTLVIDNHLGPLTVSAIGVAFLDEKTGWFGVSQVGGPMAPSPGWFINKTLDGGATWSDVKLPEPAPLPEAFTKDPYWCGAQKVVAIPPKALDLSFSCDVYQKDAQPRYYFHFHSPDGGESWRSWPETGSVDFISDVVGWRLSAKDNGQYSLEKTQDGGSNWAQVKTVQWKGNLDFVDEKVGWALATSGVVTTLVHTTDGGQSWSEVKPRATVAISPANADQLTKLAIWPTGMINVAAFSSDWTTLAVQRDYSALQLWQMKDRQRAAFIPAKPCGLRSPDSVIFSPDGTMVAAGLCNATVHVWRVADGTPVRTLPGELAKSTAFSPDGSTLVTTGYSGNKQAVMLWRLSDGATLQSLPGELIDGVAFSPDGTTLAFGSRNGLQLWRVVDGTLAKTLGTENLIGSSVAFSPDGVILASAAKAMGLQLWRVADGNLLRTLDTSPYTFVQRKLIFSPDGAILLSVRYDQNHDILSLWQVDNGKLLKTITDLQSPFSFSPDGLFLATGLSSGLQLWGVAGE